MPFGDLFKLPEGFKQRRSAPNRMEGLTFPQKINYMGQFEGPSLMALGAGISSGHPEQGWKDMAKVQQGYQQDYAGEAEQDRTRQETMQYLIGQGMDPAQAQAAAMNPAIMTHLFNLEEQKQRSRQEAQLKTFGTPQWYTLKGPDGTDEWKFGVLDNQGNFKAVEPPAGGHFVPPYEITSSKAAGGVYGKDVETARLAVLPAQMAAEDVRRMAGSVLNDPYLDQMFGTIDMTGGWLSKADLPNISPDASRVMGNLKRLMGQSFLQAREQLRGGGPITDYEGTKADQAYQTIGSAKTVKDLKVAIEEFQYWIDRGVEKLQRTSKMKPGQPGNYDVSVTPAVPPASLNPAVQSPAGAPAAPGGGGGWTVEPQP